MKVASRAIIIHDGKILLVRHKGRDFYALPGGKVDAEEDIRSAMVREIKEELNRDAQVGNLVFVHEFRYKEGSHSLEFFFLIENGEDFVGELNGTHTEIELAEIKWIPLSEVKNLKPSFLIDKIQTLSANSPIEYYSTA